MKHTKSRLDWQSAMDRLKHLAAAVRSILAVLVVFQHVKWTDAQIAAVVLAVETVGALIYAARQKNTVDTSVTIVPQTLEAEVE